MNYLLNGRMARGAARSLMIFGALFICLTSTSAWADDDDEESRSVSCSISPTSETIEEGDTLNFTGEASGGRTPYTFSWQFQGGSPSEAGNDTTVDVTYNTPSSSPYAATLSVRDRRGRSCSATAAITVNAKPPVGGAFSIDAAKWDDERNRVITRGQGTDGMTVTLVNAYDPSQALGSATVNSSSEHSYDWRMVNRRPSPVPCRVRATQSDGQVAEVDVRRAPSNCSPKDPGTPPPAAQCSDGIDNDGDGLTDFPADPGCTDAEDNDEFNAPPPPVAQCGDGIDNDGDGLTDFPADPGCTDADDNDEFNAPPPPVAQCSDGIDNDGDGLTDFPADPGCTDANDNDEFNAPPPPVAQCSDGIDNDGDGLTDFPADPGCTDADDNDEFNAPPPPVACTSPIAEHCDILVYTGPEVCVACHEAEARDMHGSVHYQQGGAFPNVTNIPGGFAAAGERPAKAAGDLVATGINTYCGTHENSPRFTCAGCHVGNGRFPMAQSEFDLLTPGSTQELAQLSNIDCLMCHQEAYKRFPDWTASGEGFTDLTLLNVTLDASGSLVHSDGDQVVRTGFAGIPNVDPITADFLFLPAGIDNLPADVPMAPMPLTTLEAAQNVHRTTKQSCLNCHAGAAGGDGYKRGDLAKENADPSINVDMHMSSAGANLTCADCHSVSGDNGEGHRLRGRGLDLRPNDVSERFTCENGGCHSSRPHGDFSNTTGSSRDKHAMKVACQTCHIPAYAKAAIGTEVARDWQDPHPSDSACNGRGGWLPREDKGGVGAGVSLTPSYTWFDGTSEIYYLGESLTGVPTVPLSASVAASFAGNFNTGDPAYVIGMPNGDVTNSAAKIYPMKEHWGKLARNDADNTLVGHSTFEFFRTGSFCRAVAVGLGIDDVNQPTSSVCSGLPGSLEMPPDTTTVPVFTYQTINHGVETSGNALGGGSAGCGSCHSALSGGPLRMDMDALGYGLKASQSVVCRQCHGSESSGFSSVHSRHVQSRGYDCSWCHNFSRPERGLRMP